MKIKISDIESKINYKIKRNFKSIGLDTATVTGLVILTTDDEYMNIESLVLSFKTQSHKEIYETMVRTFERFFNGQDVAIVEDVFVGLNRAGSIELARYGSFAIAECVKKDIPYEIISAVSARSKLKIDTKVAGKGKCKTAVKMWTDNLGLNFEDGNIVDAFVLSLLGLCKGLDFRSKVAIQKASKKATKKVAKKSNTTKRVSKNAKIKK